ncbi:type I-B CRISPR-associated protein Cas5b [Halococcus salifodinae]|uniref:type I-B CRISPR-associated protein Cas5b n=1 Tax=Halococcus salifodinae TaxID=36738 RepID=UPI0019D399CA|nr:type I-B CRISPR-associated protein Cas5b [Halococcus salifodinae]
MEQVTSGVGTVDAIPEECIVLEISGEFAHFRKPSTTSPAQTFGIPPRTTVAGMLAGMLGMERDSYYELFSRETSSVAVSLESSLRRLSVGINVLTTDGPNTSPTSGRPGKHITGHRQQTVFEVLCDPIYRVYVGLDDETVMDRMEEMFAAGKSVYTLSLGLSEYLATFEFIGRFDVSTHTGRATVRTAVPGEEVDLIPATDARYVTERSPAFMTTHGEGGRKADGSQTLTYDRNGGPIELRETPYAIVDGDPIVFS